MDTSRFEESRGGTRTDASTAAPEGRPPLRDDDDRHHHGDGNDAVTQNQGEPEPDGRVHRMSAGVPTGIIAPRLAHDPPSIEDVERRRTHLWVVAGVLLLALSAAVLLLFIGDTTDDLLLESPGLRWSFLGLSVAYIVYAVDQERNLRRLTNALIDERVMTTALQARIADLTTLTTVGRVVNSVLSLQEVLEVVLTSAFELTGARRGSVMLVEGSDLVVAASAGSQPAPEGARIPLGSGVAGWVGEQRDPVLITGRLGRAEFPGPRASDTHDGSSVVAPLVAGGELLGVLSVERPAERRPFEPTEMRSVALFAEHAATAVRNAQRYAKERRTAERLTDVLEQRSEFVATMVHELKRPLTALLGFAELLERRDADLDPAQRTQALTSVRQQGQRIQEMVDGVLRTTSGEAGANLRVSDVDLAALLADVTEATRMTAASREGATRPIDLDVDVERPAVVRGDHDALGRVFGNLLDNATKYSPAGSRIDVTLTTSDGTARVEVRDRGEGIPASQRDAIFERFRRKDYTVSGGVGLGLYIVRSLVQSHGGDVSVDSTLGEGTTFAVELPLRSPPEGGSRPS